MNNLQAKLINNSDGEDAHKILCNHLRQLTAELFTSCKKGNSGIYHAIDSFEREPELLKRIEDLENELMLLKRQQMM
jgi:hypothetical protein